MAPHSSVEPPPAAPMPSAGQAFALAKRMLAASLAVMVLGLAVVGSLPRSDPRGLAPVGGVIIVVGWLGAIAALHRLGRSGSD